MLNGIAAKLVSHLFGEYIQEIDSSQLEIEIWNGKAHLENLKIAENSFIARQIPFRVKYGVIDSITLTFPWSKLSSEPCKVDIENIFLVGEVFGGILISKDLTLQNSNNSNDNSTNKNYTVTEQSTLNGILAKILNNLIITIKNIHIRDEAKINQIDLQKQIISIGVTIPLIEVFTIDENNQKVFVSENASTIRKKVVISDFSIYADAYDQEITSLISDSNDDEKFNSFKTKMIDELKTREHQYIITPSAYEGIYSFSINEDKIQSIFYVLSDSLEISLDRVQFKAIQNLLNQYELFCKQRLYSNCGRPDRPPRSQRSSSLWWRYAHRCIVNHKFKKHIDIQNVIDLLKNRKEYYELYSTGDKNLISNFEENFETNTVTLLRTYADNLFQLKKININDLLNENEKIEIIKANDEYNYHSENQEKTNLIFNNKTKKITFNIELLKLVFILKNEKKEKITSFELNNVKMQGIKEGFENSASFSLNSFCINNFLSNQYPKILESSNETFGKINFNSIDPIKISLFLTPINFIVDVEWISVMIKFFKKKSLFIHSKNIVKSKNIDLDISNSQENSNIAYELNNKQLIQSAIDKHLRFVIDFQIFGKSNSTIIIPYQEIGSDHPSFILSFKDMRLQTLSSFDYDVNLTSSLYDKYNLQVNCINMIIADQTVSESFNLNLNLNYSIVKCEEFESLIGNIETTDLKFYITTFQFLLLGELGSYISDKIAMTQSQNTIIKLENDSANLKSYILNKFNISIPKIEILISYSKERPLYKILFRKPTSISFCNKKQSISCNIQNQNLANDEDSYIEIKEYFYNKINSNFIHIDQANINIESTNSLNSYLADISVNNVEVFLKSRPINFILVFAKSPYNFDWKLNYNKTASIENFIHKSANINKACNAERKFNFDLNISINNTAINLLDSSDSSLEEKNAYGENYIFKNILSVKNKNIKAYAHITNQSFNVEIAIPPSVITTNMQGNWKNFAITKHEIVLQITPISIFVNTDEIELNVSPLILVKLFKFINEAKNTHMHTHGEPNILPFMGFDINVSNMSMKVIHDIEINDQYEIFIPKISFKTYKTPIMHQILVPSIIMTYQTTKIFEIKNLKVDLNMKFLIMSDFDDNIDLKNKIYLGLTFNGIKSHKQSIEKWEQQTLDIIENEKDEMLLHHILFYFYSLILDAKCDLFMLTYSHKLAKHITFATKMIMTEILNLNLFDSKSSDQKDEPLDIFGNLSFNNFKVIFINQKPVATLSLSDVNVKAVGSDRSENSISTQFASLILADQNDSSIIDANSFDFAMNSTDINGKLNSIEIVVDIPSIPSVVNYVMNCPFFSFIDDFKSNTQKSHISFDFIRNLTASLQQIIIKIPFQKNELILQSSISTTLSSASSQNQSKKANIDIQFILNQKPLIHDFSILFLDGVWFLGPLILKFSVFEFYIVEQFYNVIKALKMPKIYENQKEAEFSLRTFSVNTSEITFILTQPILPFIKFEIDPFVFKQSYDNEIKKSEFEITPFLEHANFSTGSYDRIIEPFTVSFKFYETIANQSKYIDISPINISVSVPFLREIIEFKKKYSTFKDACDKNIFQKETIFLQNDTGVQMLVTIDEYDSLIILSDNAPYSLSDIYANLFASDNCDITIQFPSNPKESKGEKSFTFSIHDLCFPIIINKQILIYLETDVEIRTIHISSPYTIINNFQYDLNIYVGKAFIGCVQSGKELHIPIYTDINNGIQASLADLQKCPCSTPPLRFYSWNNHSIDSTSMPSAAFTYTFIDNINDLTLTASVFSSFDRKRSLGVVTYAPLISIFNELPHMLHILILCNNSSSPDRSIDIETGNSRNISFLTLKDSTITLIISVDGFGDSDPIIINPFDSKAQPREVKLQSHDKNNYNIVSSIVLLSEYSPTKLNSKITIYVPCVMFNQTQLPISIKKRKKIENYNNFIGNCYLYGTWKYFTKKKLTGRILLKDITSPNFHPFNCLAIGTTQNILLPYNGLTNIFLPISAIVKAAPINFVNTTVMTFTMILSVNNHFKTHRIFISPSNSEFATICEPGRRTNIMYANEQFEYDLNVKGFQKLSGLVLFSQTTNVYKLLSNDPNVDDFLIQIDIIKEEGGFCVHLSYPYLPTPFVISNMLENKDIKVYQESIAHAMNVNHLSTSLFASDKPFLNSSSIPKNTNSINININNGEVLFTSSFGSDYPRKRIQNSSYFVEVLTTKRGNQMILISEDEKSHTVKKDESLEMNNDRVKQYVVRVSLKKIMVSFIDDMIQEICFLTIDNITYFLRKRNSIEITIDSIQIDDTYSASKMPVILFVPQPKILRISLKSRKAINIKSFDNLNIDFAKIQVFLDLAFISDLYTVIRSIYNEATYENKYHPALTNSSLNNNQSKSISFYSFNQIQISPIKLDFSYRGTSGRLYRYSPSKDLRINIIRIIPNVSGAPIKLKEIKYENLRAPLHSIQESLFECYKAAFVRSIWSIAGHSDFLFNAVGIFKSVKDIIVSNDDKTRQEKIKNAGGQVLQGTEGAVRGLSSVINMTKDIAKPGKMKSLLSGFANILEKGANKIQSAKQELVDEVLPNPKRYALAFPMCRVTSDIRNERSSLMQHMFNKKHPNERLLNVIDLKQNSFVFTLFDNYIVLYNLNLSNIINETKISKINDIFQKENNIVLILDTSVGPKTFNFICENEQKARSIIILIQSIINQNRLFSK